MPIEFKLDGLLNGTRFTPSYRATEELAARVGIAFRDLNPVLRRQFRRYLTEVIQRARDKHSAAWQPNQKLPSGPKRGRLYKRSRDAMKGLAQTVRVSGAGEVAATITGPFYLKTQEFGDTITAKRVYARIRRKGMKRGELGERIGPFMFIPLPAALDERGVRLKQSAGEWGRTFVRPAKNGNGYVLYQRRGREAVALYWLAKKVRIPQRLGLRQDLKETSPAFAKQLILELEKSIDRRLKKRAAAASD